MQTLESRCELLEMQNDSLRKEKEQLQLQVHVFEQT